MDENEYINLEELLNEKKKLYQIQINNEECIIKNVGYGKEAPEMIIIENIGEKNNLSIYNCIISEDEINLVNKNEENKEIIYPVIKMTEKEGDIINQYYISIRIENGVELDKIIKKFDILYIQNKKEYITIKIIEKNINSENIIEKLIENYK